MSKPSNISFSSLGKHGRLGNMLFQVAATLGMAERYGATASFPKWDYEKYFEVPLPHGQLESNRISEGTNFHYKDWELTGDCDLYGYFQSEKYFGSTRLKLNDAFVEECKARYHIWDRETICIQIRRGDYVDNPNYYQVPVTFYICALLENFPNWRECNILFVSDDIEYCRTHFECLPNAVFSSENGDIQDLALASCCDHFIISNSTFGWWAAWLGEKSHSRIVHSGYLFEGKFKDYDISDYRPDRWIEFKRESYKIPLLDITFTIPVFFDHPDRRKNLDLSLFMLQSAFLSNYIVCEQGGEMFRYIEQFATYAIMKLPNFHRTRMLNWMAEVSKTPHVANWDADVIIPPMQIYMAVEKLRSGADMVYPYDGRFARMPRTPWFEMLQKSPDIGSVKNTLFPNREKGHLSYGGAVFFNREAFIDGGMENEYMISFGPEDYERFYRFTTLEYDVQRVGGSLFHLGHFVGENSGRKNPFYDANHVEANKVHAMSKPVLRAYIDTWSWRNQYTSSYYHRIEEGAVRSAKLVLAALPFQPKTVIDFGCGLGEWNDGNPGYIGVDYKVKPEDLLIPVDNYFDMDLNEKFPSFPNKFDLALCLEVAEHLNPARAEDLIEMLCKLSDWVLFSAAIPDQGGTGHVNERWQTYWAALFGKNGFGASGNQPRIRDNPDIELWYRQNIVLYERGGIGEVSNFMLPDYYTQIVRHLHNRLRDFGK